MPESETVQREATSIKIKPDIWKDAKIQAIKDGQTVSELVEEAIQKLMKERARDHK